MDGQPPTPNEIVANHVDRVERGFQLLFSNYEEFRKLLEKGLKFRNSQRIPEKLTMFENRFFSEELLEALTSGGSSFSTLGTGFIWDRLSKNRIVVRAFGQMSPNAFADHHLDGSLLGEHLQADTFRNLFFPASSLPERYAHAIVAIDVLKDGKENRGSGFVIQSKEAGRALLITCRHNVDPDDGITIKAVKTALGEDVKCGPCVMSDSYDIAVFPILEERKGVLFQLGQDAKIFEETYTMGFPNVPGAFPTLIGHRGEVNGNAHLYIQKSPAIIISNLVSPGSSGCVVATRQGQCVGMTIRWLEGEWDNEKMRFSAALPSSLLKKFVSDIKTAGKL